MKAYRLSIARRVMALVVLLTCACTAFAQTDNIPAEQPRAIVLGQVSSAKILPLMPQYKAVQQNLDVLREQYEAEAKKSESDFQRKFEEFMKGQSEFPKTILKKRQNELQNMLDTNAAFRVKVQNLLAEAEKAMLADVKAELSEAISAVAQEKGISLVVDLDGGSVPYVVPGLALDITKDVMLALGIEQ